MPTLPRNPRIQVQPGTPGIVSLFAFSPETALPLQQLAEALLRKESALSRADRELVAAYVSNLNECRFCTLSHAAAARAYRGQRADEVDAVLRDAESSPISPKLKAFLKIAASVQKGCSSPRDEDFAAARKLSATDEELHDVVLIAAAFCMYNRYVDGLAAMTPTDPAAYVPMGQMLATQGYVRPFPQRN